MLVQLIAKYPRLKMFNKFFDTIPNRIRNNKFLHVTNDGNEWAGSDIKSTFLENLKKQPVDWYYRNNKIQYNYNSDGYRTKEFKEVDWKNSIVMFGCSVTNGIGLHEEDTITNRLEKQLDIPVINMGVGASSMLFNLHNLSILHDGYPAPKGVIVIWPTYKRIVEYGKFKFMPHGPWDMKPNSLIDVWLKNDNHAVANAMFISKISRLMWKDKCQYLEYSWCSETTKILKCKKTSSHIDLGRDLLHPGIKTANAIANLIAEDVTI